MKKIGTHNGGFHTDDVFGTALLKSIYPDVEIIRTRDNNILATCDIVYDVGGGKYDHHQIDKKVRFNDIPYSSFGLLWEDFAFEYLDKFFPGLNNFEKNQVKRDLDDQFIQGIDAIDNGIDVILEQRARLYSITDIIRSFQPHWADKEKNMDNCFMEAVLFAERILYNKAQQLSDSFYAKRMVQKALNKRKNKKILILKSFVPWKKALLELDKDEEVEFVVYPSSDGTFHTQVVPKTLGVYGARVDLPKQWAGLRDEELSKVTKVPGCIFCHTSQFLAVHQTMHGAIRLAEKAIS